MTIQAIESILSEVAGTRVEVTIRGERSFTWSTEERNEAAAEKLSQYAKKDPRASVTVAHDEECGTFVYLEIAA